MDTEPQSSDNGDMGGATAGNSTGTDLTLLGVTEDFLKKVSSRLRPSGISVERQELDVSSNTFLYKNCKVLGFLLSQDNFVESFKVLKTMLDRDPTLTILVFDKGLSVQDIVRVGEYTFAIIDLNDLNSDLVNEAIRLHVSRKSQAEQRQKIKDQNKKLETLNKNLELLVHERTRKEFEASEATEISLKAIQSILSFIKNLSKCQSIEEILIQLQIEFRKVPGLMPPILILDEGVISFRVFYFQGKQLIEKFSDLSPQQHSFYGDDESEIRSALSNYFGRPFGPLKTQDLSFQSKELRGTKARIIFESTIGGQKSVDVLNENNERWPILTMAIENLLLKEGMHLIAIQWSKTFNKMEDPILILDENFHMSLSNSSYHKSSSRTCYSSFANQTKPCKDCPLSKTFETGQPQTSNVHMGNKVYRVHSYPIRIDEEGRVSHAINQYVDITQTIDLRSRVIQGEKMAAVGLLAGNIAHELNNPLTGIYSLADLLLSDFDKQSNTYKDMIEIKEAASRCQRIIKDLLDFSSVGSQSKPKVIDVNMIIQKTLPLVKMAMREQNTHVDLFVEELNVKCNPQLLQQVIFNLINNACQAMEGGGVLTIESKKIEGSAEVVIRDTGPGIPTEIQEFVFDPFFTTKEEGKGTGLGLSMSKSVVQRAGGDLLLNDDYVDGTEFVIKLPLVKL